MSAESSRDAAEVAAAVIAARKEAARPVGVGDYWPASDDPPTAFEMRVMRAALAAADARRSTETSCTCVGAGESLQAAHYSDCSALRSTETPRGQ